MYGCCIKDRHANLKKARHQHSSITASDCQALQTTQPEEIKLFTTEELVSMDPGINQPGGHNQKDELMEGCNLALYGRGDHLTEEVLTLRDKQKMTFRQLLLAVSVPL